MVNNGHAHWLTISTIGAVNVTVNVYDSLHECQLICAMAMSEDRLVKCTWMKQEVGDHADGPGKDGRIPF